VKTITDNTNKMFNLLTLIDKKVKGSRFYTVRAYEFDIAMQGEKNKELILFLENQFNFTFSKRDDFLEGYFNFEKIEINITLS
tara:strand:- start:14741 stop:14989 length:249 start_codon:yes stop_codon:yes gene_type:complete